MTELKLYVKPHKDVAMEKWLQSNSDLRGLHQQGSFKQRQHSVTTLNPILLFFSFLTQKTTAPILLPGIKTGSTRLPWNQSNS